MGIKRYATNRDVNEPAIVEALIAVGADVEYLDEPCDLLVGYRHRNYLIEVKGPRGKLTKNQGKFSERWRGQHDVARTPDDALRIIGAIRPRPPHGNLQAA